MNDLKGLKVLITRPKDQSENLSELISQAGGRPIRFSAIEIHAQISEQHRALLNQADQFDLLIFISTNAVDHAFQQLPDILPASAQIAAIGQATAHRLAEKGLIVDYKPEQGFSSEDLLALPQLADMKQKKVLIIRGQGGRELLKQRLEQRGAEVHYAEVYRRVRPKKSADNLVRSWSQLVDVVTITSLEIWLNLWHLLGESGQNKIKQTPIFVFSARIAEQARSMGCDQVWISDSASDQALLQSIIHWHSKHRM